MPNINFKDKNMLIIIGVIVIIILVGLFITKGRGGQSKDADSRESVLPDVELLPTVDSSVTVSLSADKLKQDATLEISNIPNGTELIEYELSYDASVEGERVPTGVIGTIEFDGEDPVVRKITLGTCSSGVCKYDKGVNEVRVTLKFEGDYGARLFEDIFKI